MLKLSSFLKVKKPKNVSKISRVGRIQIMYKSVGKFRPPPRPPTHTHTQNKVCKHFFCLEAFAVFAKKGENLESAFGAECVANEITSLASLFKVSQMPFNGFD